MALVFLLATFAHAQISQFLFDPNGNLLVQSANLNTPPEITGQPQNQTPGPGETAAFSVVAKGALPLSFQWRFNGADIGGATDDALLLENVSTNNEGQYTVVLTNPSGSVTSAPAMLWIDTDGDNLGDSWELTYFNNLDQSANDDFDFDGSTDFEEFRNGTDPTDRRSFAFYLTVISDAGSVMRTPNRTSYTNGQTVTLTAIPPTNGAFHAWLGDIVTRSNPVTLVMTNDKVIYARFTPIVFQWTSLGNGDWDTAANWTPNLAPGSNDTAVIASTVTVTLNTPAACADVSLGSGGTAPTLTGSGTVIVRGKLAWLSGSMSGSGRTVIETGGKLELNPPTNTTVSLFGRTLENGGTARWTGDGSVALNSSAVLTNRAGALFEVQSAASFSVGLGNSRFDNAGTFRKSINRGMLIVPLGISFNNYGAVEIQNGTLNFGGGGTHTASSSMTGAGHLTFSGGTADLAGLVNVSGSHTFIDLSTANFTGNTICTNNTMTFLNGGTANFSGTGLVSPAVVNLINGTLGGTSTVTVLNAINWIGGTMSGSGRTIISPGVTLGIGNASGIGALLNTRTLENGGTVLWTGSGDIALNLGAVVTNRPGALFHVQNAASFTANVGSGRIDNAGIFRKSGNTGTTTVGGPNTVAGGVSFNNSGAVEIQTGTLSLVGGGAHSGSFDVPANTALILAGGTHTANASSSITGAGQLTVSGGTANLAGLVNVSGSQTFSTNSTANFTGNTICTNNTVTISGGTANFSGTGLVSPAVVILSNGTLDGTSTVTVNTVMNWTAGTISGSGRTIIPIGATLTIANASGVGALLNTRTLENGGTVLWTGTGSIALNLGAVVTNRPGALFHVQNAASFVANVGVGRIDNAGTFRKSANTGMTTIGNNIPFNNSGVVEIQIGTFSLAGGGTHSGSFDVPLGTTLTLSGGTHTANGNSSITGAGQFVVSGGTANLAGLVNVSGSQTFSGNSTANFTGNTICTNNTVTFSGGTANFSGTGLVSPAVVTLSNGTLDGTSTVTVNTVMNWTAGTMSGSGRTIIPPGATLTIANASGVGALVNTRTLDNGGTILWRGSGDIALNFGAVVTNRPGALFHVQNAASFAANAGVGRIDNAGTFRKSGNIGTTSISSFGGISFNNYGTVDIRSGILAANGGYVSSSNARLNCALGGTRAGTNYGKLQVAGAVTLNGGLSVELINGFVPATNDTFAVVTAAVRNGTFSSFSYPSNAVTMQLSNTANSVVVRVTNVFIVPQPALLPGGLISWWRAEGNALDSIATNHGVLTNGATFAAGKVGQTFALDGTNAFVEVPDSVTLRPASVTIEAWVNFFATNGIRIVLVKPLGSGTFDSYGLALQDGAVLAAIADNSGFGQFLVGPANTVTGQWYHLAFTFDDASKQQVLYVNAIPVASGTANKTMSYDTHPVLLGADVENGVLSFFHHGQIDEPSVYNRALTSDEIATIYNAGAAGKQRLTTIARPMLFPPVLSNSNVLLSWTAVSNQTYRLEFNPDLGVTNWVAVPGDITSLSNRATKLDEWTPSNRFYRVRVVP